MKKSYTHRVACPNCYRVVRIKIPFGTDADGYVTPCPRCGVKMVINQKRNN